MSLAEFHDETNNMFHCLRCERVFVSFDVYWHHRDGAGMDSEGDRVELEPGDAFPSTASVGTLEPCGGSA
ncbi:hypothetical protein [Halomarina rubra]|uniref:C2H2-type domain-containing protein n=1 Tax=Halomarina rubra TaxID=2071873 RepID=A0ABD6B2A5_9EURY|nr:hypothetical protein [Halomarina rubra]